jgi:hypothetical protein
MEDIKGQPRRFSPPWHGISTLEDGEHPKVGRRRVNLTLNTEMKLTRLDPSYREVVAARLKSVLKNYDSYDSFEISDPRWVHSIKGPAWLTCVRFRDQGRLRNFASFLDGKSVVDDRFAVQTDDCDLQTYYPFDRVPTGLNPLH